MHMVLSGTPPIAEAVGMGAAIDYLTNIGMSKIEAYELELTKYLYQVRMEGTMDSQLHPSL